MTIPRTMTPRLEAAGNATVVSHISYCLLAMQRGVTGFYEWPLFMHKRAFEVTKWSILIEDGD